MQTKLILILIAVIAVSGCTQQPAQKSVKVYEVVDGDTIDINYRGTNDTIRLLGVDTPEVHVETTPSEYEGVPVNREGRQCLRNWGERASNYMKENSGDEIRIEVSGDKRGSYGRLLAYVYTDNSTESLNYRLVKNGYARVYKSDFNRLNMFLNAETAAQEANRGLWNCTTIQGR
jgi:micrococcal nuclease